MLPHLVEDRDVSQDYVAGLVPGELDVDPVHVDA